MTCVICLHEVQSERLTEKRNLIFTVINNWKADLGHLGMQLDWFPWQFARDEKKMDKTHFCMEGHHYA